MLVLQLALVSSAKGCLHSEHIGDLEFSPQCDTSSGLFRLVHTEATVLKREEVQQLTHDEGEHSCRVRSILEIIAVHKDVLAT